MDEDGMVPSTAVPFARDYAFPPLDGVASNLSDGMFIGAIRGQMSPEQQAKWLPLAQSHQILGPCKCSRSLCVFFGSQADFIYAQNTRYEDLTPRQRENFVELTGKAGNL